MRTSRIRGDQVELRSGQIIWFERDLRGRIDRVRRDGSIDISFDLNTDYGPILRLAPNRVEVEVQA